MSNTTCPTCGALAIDTATGRITGCRHRPPERESTEAEQRLIDAAWLDGVHIELPAPRAEVAA